MDLDMYLTKRLYIGAHYEHNNVKCNVEVERKGKVSKIEEPIQELIIPVGYWRKANAIHNWFVKNVQEGTDDCKEYEVQSEDLLKLRDACKEVLIHHAIEEGLLNGDAKEVAEKILPTAEGFFFGGTDYDEWYVDGLKETVTIIDKALNQMAIDESNGFYISFYYQSSW